MAIVSYGSHRSLRWSCRAPRSSKLRLTQPARDRAADILLDFCCSEHGTCLKGFSKVL
ncbi:hypothetical protein HanHA300_Chr04g0138121 [Helianthus annuus]|nr:hypothetical protein HanHA300_Chr04g0138121 [Helianthus annuus]KAJ0597139.1 hypothetical protein HanHA89_Chr04g0151101 [Helianthus annuus]KAJ0757820.1 hypothetical protein HanLR1_Chr04g0143191 [Helianthus annuus]